MMFKLFPTRLPGKRRSGSALLGGNVPRWLSMKHVGVLGLLVLGACRSAPPLPPADLQQTGWAIHQGQAIWSPRRKAPEIAGEILIATHRDGRILVQFTKNPFPLITAGIGPGSWEMSIPTQGKHYSYRGKPPTKVLWFQLPTAVSGQELARPWVWTRPDSKGRWRLSNESTGERLEGYFWP